MRKLVDIFNTKYFPEHYNKDLTYFLSMALRCLSNSDTDIITDLESVREAINHFRSEGVIVIDIAEARFVPSTIATLQAHTRDGIILCDTNNGGRDAILVENRRRAKVVYDTEELPRLDSINDLPNYIGNLPTDTVYTINNMHDSIAIPLVSLVTLFKPEVQFDLEYKYEKLFRYVSRNILLDSLNYEEFNYIVGNTIYRDKFNKDGKIYIPGEGLITYDKFYNNFIAIPSIFGDEFLANKKEWELLQNAAIDDIKEYFKHSHRTITDLYPRR